jgi:hypothetical protein
MSLLLQIPVRKWSRPILIKNGFIIQCCHCRKIKNQEFTRRWDWVPALVATANPRTSHTFCPYCLEFYYNIAHRFLS